MKNKFSTILFLFFIFPLNLFAYSSITVPVQDPVYRKLDKLAAFGLIKSMMKGQRPYVRSEIGRLIAEAMENYPAFEAKYRDDPNLTFEKSGRLLKAKVYVDGILKDLKARYAPELIQRRALPGEVPRFQGKPLDYVRFDFLYLDEPKETVLPNNGLGGVDAVIQNLVAYREGRHYQSGTNLAFETQHWMRLGKYFAFQVQPRFQMQIARDNLSSENQVFVQRVNGRFTWNKLDIEIGRDSIDWGPSPTGGMLFSTNARPLDMIKISSISPFEYPFFFKKLGKNEMSLVIANLGPEQNFEDPWMVAYKISNRRDEHFEFGMSQALEIGGQGSPPIGVGGVLAEFFDMSSNNTRSNRNVNIELLGRIPKLRGLELYAEINFADFTTNLSTLFADNTSYFAGAYLPRLNFTGTLDLRLEYRRLAPRYARSPLYTTGMAENQLFLGDALGPDAWAVTLESYYEMNPENWFSFQFQFARRHQDLYQQNGSEVTQIADLGEQNRYLFRLGWRRWWRKNIESRVGVGFEQVSNFDFSGNNRFNWVGEAGFTIYLPDAFGIPPKRELASE